MAKKTIPQQSSVKHIFPPVVTVLGHVDHGKTSLLDAIRKTSIAQREAGGITQKIGASSVVITHENEKRKITFIDTPGHEAFSKMRSRGATAADIALLIVSSVDGVMPQTIESIALLKEAKIPHIVVLTKSDLADRSIEKVKQQLLKEEILLEGLGGDVPYIEVSAKTGKNVKELLELILLVFDLNSTLFSDRLSDNKLNAIIIESKLDQKSGPRATIVVKDGTIRLREEVVVEGIPGKVRTLLSETNQQVQSATVGDAVEILGFEKVPPVGGIVIHKAELKNSLPVSPTDVFSPDYAPHTDQSKLSIVLSADTLGSLEAIVVSLPKDIAIVSQKTGEMSEADILLAKSTGALAIGFNIKIRNEVLKLATTERVLFKNYTIIYELIDEITDVLEGKQLALQEQIYGSAKVRGRFPFEKTFVMGVVVLDGRVAKGDKVRIMRDEAIIGESAITSVRQGKNPVSKVEKGQEAGVIISPFLDFTIGDMIICHG